MSHTDKYGRNWRWEPGHDPDLMLQIPKHLMKRFCNFNWALGLDTDNVWDDFVGDAEVDCYLLKSPIEGWWTGIRRSDEPNDYMSVNLSPALVSMLIEKHRGSCSMKEYSAIFDLVGELQ